MKVYAGIGSRQTPPEVLQKMEALGLRLQKLGYWLRSGGAIGADQAFERLVSPEWKVILRPKDSTPQSEAIAQSIHPAWHACSDYAKKLHGRNSQIILGVDLSTPAEFVICWTSSPDRGGTRMGMALAGIHKIPVFNLFSPECEAELEKLLAQKEKDRKAHGRVLSAEEAEQVKKDLGA